MRQELERLIHYIGPGSGRQIDETELEAHLGVEPQASFQDAAQQAFGGKAAACQGALRRAESFDPGQCNTRSMSPISAPLRTSARGGWPNRARSGRNKP